MVFKNELYPIHFYGRVRGKCDGRLQNWPGIANERPKFLAMEERLNNCFLMHVHRHITDNLDSNDMLKTLLLHVIIAGSILDPFSVYCYSKQQFSQYMYAFS